MVNYLYYLVGRASALPNADEEGAPHRRAGGREDIVNGRRPLTIGAGSLAAVACVLRMYPVMNPGAVNGPAGFGKDGIDPSQGHDRTRGSSGAADADSLQPMACL